MVCLPAGKPKQKAMGKAVKTPSLTWMEALPPPPPLEELEQLSQDNEEPPEHEEMDLGWVGRADDSALCCVVLCRVASDFSWRVWYRTPARLLRLPALTTQLLPLRSSASVI